MTQSIIDYRLSMEHQLAVGLRKLRKLQRKGILKMQQNDVDFAITKNAESYGVDSLTEASFQAIGGIGDKAIIVYITDNDAHFGLYDETKEACLPIDIHEVVSTWVDESVYFQRNMLTFLRGNIDEIIQQSTAA